MCVQPNQATDSWSSKPEAHGEKTVEESESYIKVHKRRRGPHRTMRRRDEVTSVHVKEKLKNGLNEVWRVNTWLLLVLER